MVEKSTDGSSLWEIPPIEPSNVKRVEPIPFSLYLNWFGLVIYSAIYLFYRPIVWPPGYLEPQECGTPQMYFMYTLLPYVIVPAAAYGLLRWATIGRIRNNAQKFHIACFIFEVALVLTALLQPYEFKLSQSYNHSPFSFLDYETFRNVLNLLLNVGRLAFIIWMFVSIDFRRIRIWELLIWAFIIVYVLVFMKYLGGYMPPIRG